MYCLRRYMTADDFHEFVQTLKLNLTVLMKTYQIKWEQHGGFIRFLFSFFFWYNLHSGLRTETSSTNIFILYWIVFFISMQCCISLLQYAMHIEDANKFNNTKKLYRNDGEMGQPMQVNNSDCQWNNMGSWVKTKTCILL